MEIRRDIVDIFLQWKNEPERKPILLKGARQIGKTWAMEAFGKVAFEYCAKFDFDRQPSAAIYILWSASSSEIKSS